MRALVLDTEPLRIQDKCSLLQSRELSGQLLGHDVVHEETRCPRARVHDHGLQVLAFDVARVSRAAGAWQYVLAFDIARRDGWSLNIQTLAAGARPRNTRAIMPAATFLQPDAAEQSQLRRKQEEKLRAKKAKDKVDATERRRKRDAEKERIAAIEEDLAARKAKREESPFKRAVEDARQSPEDIERDQVCNAYLDRDAMLGRSGYDDREIVKCLCGDKGVRVFDGDLRMWGTRSHEQLTKLMQSYLWAPFGVPEQWHERLLKLAADRTAALHLATEAANMAKREASMTVSPEEAARLTAERERAQRAAQLREWYTAPTEKECSEVKALKLDDAGFLDKTQRLLELGPIVGLSPEGRVLRWLDIEVYGARCKYERDPSYWDEEFMSAVEDGARSEAASKLKRLVGT